MPVSANALIAPVMHQACRCYRAQLRACFQVSKGTPTTLALLGELERIILWQLSAEEWKIHRQKAAAKPAGRHQIMRVQTPSAFSSVDCLAPHAPSSMAIWPVHSGSQSCLQHA